MYKVYFQKLIDYGLLAVLFLYPFSVNVALISWRDTVHPLISINISIADFLIFIISILWIVKITVYKEWQMIKLPPYAVFVFLILGTVSVINALAIGEWLKELIKLTEYFLLFYTLLINNLFFIKTNYLIRIFLIQATIIIVVAVIQYFSKTDDYLVRGLFPNSNILGIYLCMIIPIAYTQLIFSTNSKVRIWMGALLCLASIVLLSASALLAIVISLFILNIIAKSNRIWYAYFALIALIGIAYLFVLPGKNSKAIKDFASIYEQGSISNNYYHRSAVLESSNRNILFKKNYGENYLQLSSDFYLSKIKLKITQGNLYKEMDNIKTIKNRYLEMQASINMIAENAYIGVGLGNFQHNIGIYYQRFPKINTSQPNQTNGYFIVASTIGLLGLSAFLWIFLLTLKTNFLKYKSTYYNIIYLGLLGSFIAVLIENFFSYLLSSSLLVPLIFLMCLSIKPLKDVDNSL